MYERAWSLTFAEAMGAHVPSNTTDASTHLGLQYILFRVLELYNIACITQDTRVRLQDVRAGPRAPRTVYSEPDTLTAPQLYKLLISNN